MSQHRFIIAGGGTGGHIFPAIAIANAIKKQDANAEILFVGATGKMEMEKVPQAGYKIEGLTIAGYNRSSLIKNVWLPFKIIYSFVQVSQIFKRFKPTAVIGVGGYSSFPVLKFAQSKGIYTFIHESNSFAGKSNIMIGRRATKVFTATHGMEKFFPVNKIAVTGNPVRQSITSSSYNREEAIRFFGLDPSKRTVLSIGGSLGAKTINEALAGGLEKFKLSDLQLIWQTGKPFIEQAKAAKGNSTNVSVYDFITKMEMAYAAADIVISRSGAMAIAELCVAGKPCIFVPYPFAAEDHQTANAKQLVDRGAALMVSDKDAYNKLLPELFDLAGNGTKLAMLADNIRTLAVKDADMRIVKEIYSIIDSE